MDDFGAGGGAGERHHAGIAEQVQHFHGASRGADPVLRKSPVYGVFLEEAHVAEGGAARGEGQAVPAHRPGVDRAGGEDFPLAGAVLVRALGGEAGIRFPALHGFGRIPERLRVRADDGLAAEAFELLQVAAVEQGIVFPVIGDQQAGLGLHQAYPRWRQAS